MITLISLLILPMVIALILPMTVLIIVYKVIKS